MALAFELVYVWHFNRLPSGLYLTKYRAYDPDLGALGEQWAPNPADSRGGKWNAAITTSLNAISIPEGDARSASLFGM